MWEWAFLPCSWSWRKTFQLLFSIENYVNCGLSYMTFTMLTYIPSIHTLLKTFLINGYWALSNAFSASKMITLFAIHFADVMDQADWYVNIEPSLHLWTKSHLIMVNDSLMYCWYWFANILLKIFITPLFNIKHFL